MSDQESREENPTGDDALKDADVVSGQEPRPEAGDPEGSKGREGDGTGEGEASSSTG